MPPHPHPTSTSTSPPTNPATPFHHQRSLLISEIALSLDHVLQNINKLNRSLEGVIAVGNEFGNVEGLWSVFEGVMRRDRDEEEEVKEEDGGDGDEEGGKEEDGGEGEEEGEEGGQVTEGRGRG